MHGSFLGCHFPMAMSYDIFLFLSTGYILCFRFLYFARIFFFQVVILPPAPPLFINVFLSEEVIVQYSYHLNVNYVSRVNHSTSCFILFFMLLLLLNPAWYTSLGFRYCALLKGCRSVRGVSFPFIYPESPTLNTMQLCTVDQIIETYSPLFVFAGKSIAPGCSQICMRLNQDVTLLFG
ncbi:hypothetical protein GJAV_G00221090 [Gymnothorax javanicus]|nr:hypothetical protein GJAV_G00221090 [Gymnothorax javanicus]